ncbi:MAG: phosphatidic acid phosphatase, partial [Segetibacter sp.]
DSTEVEFGLPVRHFKSFMQASQEAAISRYYGGIHYMPAIVNGVEEGKKIGILMTQKLRTRK